jgi:putative glutamine amidotransferase
MPARLTRPVVGIPCCVKVLGPHPFHVVGDKYMRAVSDGAGAIPFPIAALGDWWDVDDLLDRLDGLLITGSPSNVEPRHYGATDEDDDTLHDPARDATTLPLIRRAIERGVPLLAICRGLQEVNVALGGTLHQHVERLAGRLDHRADEGKPVEGQYGPAHPVALAPGGRLARLFGRSETRVNSVHSQGIDRLADGLAVEATAPDGQIEAICVERAAGFALAVQWHPEWRFWENPDSVALFRALGEAASGYAAQRGRASAA